jgi:hypothetical protein
MALYGQLTHDTEDDHLVTSQSRNETKSAASTSTADEEQAKIQWRPVVVPKAPPRS